MEQLKIFISHSWQNNCEEYKFVCDFLNNTFKSGWINHSIPKEKPYEIWKEGKKAWEAEKIVFAKRLDILAIQHLKTKEEIKNIFLELNEIKRSDTLGSSVSEVKAIFENFVDNLSGSIGGILDSKEQMRKRVEERLREIESGKSDLLKSKKDELSNLYYLKNNLLNKIEDDISNISNKLCSLNNKIYFNYESLTQYQINDIRTNTYSKFGVNQRSFPQMLTREIDNKIISCDIFIIISGKYSQYAQWLEYELNIANKFGKNIISVMPFGQNSASIDVTLMGIKSIPCETNAMINALRNFTYTF